MSQTKAIHLRIPLALALLALAAVVLWVAGANSAVAGGTTGSVALDPDAATVGEGGTTSVDIVATPPTQGLSIWIVEVAFDTDVVEVVETQQGVSCSGAVLPGGGAQASTCLGRDTNSDQTPDAVVALGGYVRKEGSNAVGLTQDTVLATINFQAVGTADECSDLTITVTSWVGPDSSEPTPTVNNGEICITSGVTRIWGDVDCNGTVAARDTQGVLRNILSQNALSQTEPCPDIGTTVTVGGVSVPWGDVDCNGTVAARDTQGILRHILSQNALSQTEPCPDIGSSVTVS